MIIGLIGGYHIGQECDISEGFVKLGTSTPGQANVQDLALSLRRGREPAGDGQGSQEDAQGTRHCGAH